MTKQQSLLACPGREAGAPSPASTIIVPERNRSAGSLHEQTVPLSLEDYPGSLADLAIESMPSGLIMFSAEGRIRFYNTRVSELLPIGRDELRVGLSLEDYLTLVGPRFGWSPERIQRVIDNHWLWMAKNEITNLEHYYDDGMVLSISCRPMTGGGLVLTYEDVTMRVREQAKMRHLAYHDPLTGLPNRRRFKEGLAALIEDEPVAAAMLIDLDHFKSVNDTLGHGVGDALLIAMANRVKGTLRPQDLFFRLGGDEFAVMLLPCDETALAVAGTRIIEAIDETFMIDGHAINVGCSIGISMAEAGDTADMVIRKADLALYRAKERGRGCTEWFEPSLMERAERRQKAESDLRRALLEGEFELEYQALSDLTSQRIMGFEALIRWNHPERGRLMPADFLPLCEDNGAIVEIGGWALEEACRQACSWPDHLRIAVNISVVQFRDAQFVERVCNALETAGLAADRLEIEVTETVVMKDLDRAASILCKLRGLGVRVSMDDFGTGYSSLSHLRDLAFDRIKLDRSFIETACENAASGAILRAIVAMSRELSIMTLGEGVETDEQLARLTELGCDEVQGFLLGRPMPGDEVLAVIARAGGADPSR